MLNTSEAFKFLSPHLTLHPTSIALILSVVIGLSVLPPVFEVVSVVVVFEPVLAVLDITKFFNG